MKTLKIAVCLGVAVMLAGCVIVIKKNDPPAAPPSAAPATAQTNAPAK
jgi:hypothetical protein